MQDFSKTVAMAFGGGLGLAAYHAGAYEALWKRSVRVHWLAGSSAGAVTAALIAGNSSDKGIEQLRAFWHFPPLENCRPEPWRHLFGWIGAIGTHLGVVAVILTHACPRLTRSYSVACMI
jgi:NTE family protein